jgi:hypothetical protein
LWPFFIGFVDKRGPSSRVLDFLDQKPLNSLPDWGKRQREGLIPVRVMFLTWLTLIATGLIAYSIIGLSHH